MGIQIDETVLTSLGNFFVLAILGKAGLDGYQAVIAKR